MLHSKFFSLAITLLFVFSASLQAQVQKISLGQTTGEFTVKSLTLSPGDYQFEIANNGVDHEVGFVLVQEGITDQANHIKEAYVSAPVKNGTTSMTGVVSLSPGEYVYFCPLNPTKQNKLTVKAPMENIKLVQTTGQFETKNLELVAGDYQFEIKNQGVDHEVGFVVAPKGKTDQANHIQAAYVKAPVKMGTSSMTNVVSLTPGEYVYFCPLNPTKEYDLTVKAPMKHVKLVQTPGKFEMESLELAAGDYQFEIMNQGVDHEVGFVVAPKGKTDQANHIQAAYVKAPVKTNTSSMTNVVSLTPGEYVYFCPLNPTKEYNLTVK